ncbi:MAG TPA: hypothetical protein VN934_06075 [Candidatus Tumulicola sp.]|nr:hypothetical protein [Candidatus Tumulicola sp.]
MTRLAFDVFVWALLTLVFLLPLNALWRRKKYGWFSVVAIIGAFVLLIFWLGQRAAGW